jgi:3-methylfumaryl-CoA hydratase
VTLLDDAGIATARLRSAAEFAAHHQLAARDRWREVDSPAGPIRALLPPVSVAGYAPVMGAIPALGQHTAAVLAEAGLGPADQAAAKPRTVERTELITEGPAEALAGLLGVPLPDFAAGAGLPLLWHWLYLLDRPPQAALGEDGHVRDGLLVPPGPGWRRLFAGGRVTQLGLLYPGAAATRRSWIASSTEKAGRSGRLMFVTVGSEVSQQGRILITEEQDIVYRHSAGSGPGPERHEPDGPGVPTDAWHVEVDPVLLFRFSALTYNSHRIHYDRDYARVVEGYPSLVVHGPLQALLMAELARRRAARPALCRFDYRLAAPLLEGQGLAVSATEFASETRLTVRDAAGRRTATATFRPAQSPAPVT